MVNQLWSSRETRPKDFVTSGKDPVRFGWKTIEDLWKREKLRRDSHLVRLVPGMVQSFIERDAWTKLNVKPAKIMQVTTNKFNSEACYLSHYRVT